MTRTREFRFVRGCLFCVVLAALQFACVKVSPAERGTLAHPTMAVQDMSFGIDGHVRGVSEGASGGGLGGGGGGCGCN